MKKLFAVFFSLVFVISAFAQTTQVKPILSESDVSSFVKNFNKLRAELEKLNIDMQDTQSLATATLAAEKVKGTLEKYGFGDERGFEKIRAIALAYAIEAFNKELEADPQAAAMLKSMNLDPLASVRGLIAPSDIELVKKHYNELLEVFENLD